MSILGADTFGRWQLGSFPGGRQFIALTAAGGSFAQVGQATTFTISEAANVGAFALTGVSASFSITGAVNVGTFAVTGVPALLTIVEVMFADTGVFVATGVPTTLTRDFINWLRGPFAGETWSTEPAPAPAWSAANSQASSWNNRPAPPPNWAPVAPPSNAWTVDPAQAIPPPVSE